MSDSEGQGTVDVYDAGLLTATLDNTASTFTTVTVKCQARGQRQAPLMPVCDPSGGDVAWRILARQVCLESFSQIAKLDAFKQRQELKAS